MANLPIVSAHSIDILVYFEFLVWLSLNASCCSRSKTKPELKGKTYLVIALLLNALLMQWLGIELDKWLSQGTWV